MHKFATLKMLTRYALVTIMALARGNNNGKAENFTNFCLVSFRFTLAKKFIANNTEQQKIELKNDADIRN